jgi:hypothetical protein
MASYGPPLRLSTLTNSIKLTSLRFRLSTGRLVRRRVALSPAVIFLLALPLVCCAQADTKPAEVSPGQEFTLKLGQTARVKGEGLKVKFASVVEDSRCPKGEQCIRQGSAKIRVEVAGGGGEPFTLELDTEPGRQEAARRGYALTLVALDPYPTANRQAAPEDYRATLVVEKNGAESSPRPGVN